MASWNEPAARAPYLVFRAGGGDYAVGILNVRGILPYEEVTPVTSSAPPAIRGELNLRRTVVPVIDLAVKVGLPPAPVTRHTCVVVLEVAIAGVASRAALVVDAVSEVVELGPRDVSPPPPVGPGVAVGFIVGIGKVGPRSVHLLDPERILADGGAAVGDQPAAT